jgi:hypothetical protein
MADAERDPTPDHEVTDELPEDLDASGFVGPYVFPDNNRRRIPGYLYLVVGAGCVVAWALSGGDGVLVNGGFLGAGVLLIAAGAYHLLAGWDLVVDERDALVAATRRVGFAVGHASAQMGWRGLRSRPTWRILLYSAEDPPTTRGWSWSTASTGRSWPRSSNRTPRTGPTSTRPCGPSAGGGRPRGPAPPP